MSAPAATLMICRVCGRQVPIDLAACLTAFKAQRDFVRRALRRQGMGPDDAKDL